MAETLLRVRQSNTEDLLKEPSLAVDGAEPSAEELTLAGELVRSARARGVAMTGPGGMLKALTKSVIEPRRRTDQALYAVVMEAYVNGVSSPLGR